MKLAPNRAEIHAEYSDDWWTPPEWMEWAMQTLGVSHLANLFDPCPRDWTPGAYDGLAAEWRSPAYVNHPGSKQRGTAARWWAKYQAEQERHGGKLDLVWCAFSCEQLRHLRPSPFHLPGWLVMPRIRVGFVWGGPDRFAADGKQIRAHGEAAKSPGQWTVFWTTRAPATPPTESVIVRTA